MQTATRMVPFGIITLLIASGLALPTPALAEDRLHHSIDLALEPASGAISVTDRIEVSGRERLAIKPAPGLTVDEITLNGEAIAPASEDGVTWIDLAGDGEHRVELVYGGVLEQSGRPGGLSPIVTADGAFLPYGIGWLANGGAEDDRVTYELTVTVPAPFLAVATGRIAEETQPVDAEEGYHRATFVAEQPTEPPSVFAGHYMSEVRRHGEIDIRTYFPPDRRELSPTYLDRAAGYVDLFEDRIGGYPYDDFSMIAAPLPVGLGFPGLTYIAAQILHMPFMQTRSLAHEIAHNWWGNGIFVDHSEGNWAEGLTTYMADYGLAEIEGDDAAWKMRLAWLRDFAALPEERDRPISSFRSKGHDADQVVGYNKVAMVFHMLERDLGEEAFAAGIRDFWQEHRFQTAGWSDLQASFEAAAGGRSLDDFFEPWLRRTGAPALALDRAELRDADGSFALDLAISSDTDAYDLLVPVQIETADGLEERTVRLATGKVETTLNLEKKPLSVGIDQRHDLFRRLAENEAPPILRDVTLNAGTLTVIAVNGSRSTTEIAEELAARTLDTGLKLADADDDIIGTSPLMLIGTADLIEPVLAKAGLDTIPPELRGRGTARSWVATRDGAPPALVVEADDEAALGALLRPLPHYGRQSFLVFDGRKAIEKGVWPTGDNALTKRFD